jgi:predicted carbohydrate-binding protein with CBM5 and CBM33 domain
MSDATQFFYNVSTGQVEESTTKGQSKDLLGPYPTREAATAALETARQKTENWDEEDRRWKD